MEWWESLLTACTGLFGVWLGHYLQIRSQREQRKQALEDQRHQRRQELLEENLPLVKEYVDDLITEAEARYYASYTVLEDWDSAGLPIETRQKAREAVDKLRSYEEKWLTEKLERSIKPRLLAIGDATLTELCEELDKAFLEFRGAIKEGRPFGVPMSTEPFRRVDSLAKDFYKQWRELLVE